LNIEKQSINRFSSHEIKRGFERRVLDLLA